MQNRRIIHWQKLCKLVSLVNIYLCCWISYAILQTCDENVQTIKSDCDNMWMSEMIPRKELRLYREDTAADFAIDWSPKNSYSGNFCLHSDNTFGSSEAT